MKKILTAGIFILLLVSSCNKKPNPLENYDRATLLKNLADSVIVPSYNNLNNAVIDLQSAADAFTAAPGTSNLEALRTAWNNAVKEWMHTELYNLEYANINSLSSQIGATQANFAVIEQEVHGVNTIDENYIASTGTTRKGFAAVEYLLYGENISVQSIIDSFTVSTDAGRRKQYLTSLCRDIHTKSAAAYADWNQGNSYTSFTTHTQLDISGSLNLIVNALTEHVEFVRKAKVGKPSGIDNGGTADGTLCEYRLAPRSIENIRENILAWKDLYTGKSGKGLDDYLDQVNAQYNGTLLSSTISAQLDACLAKANDITVPLSQAVTQQPAQVTALHLELKKLTVLTKVDLASNLGVIITFSDNDGD